jgi:probable phosphoglycerate mutase
MMSTGFEVLHAMAAERDLPSAIDQFYFVRHGETEGNYTRIVQHPSIPLNETGRNQATAAAECLFDIPFSGIFASDFRRAHETAQAIQRATDKPLTVRPNLCERKFGELIGTNSLELDWTMHPAGGESLETFVDRTLTAVAEILAEQHLPVIVAHGGNLRVIAGSFGMALNDEAIANATPLHFVRNGAGWDLTIMASGASAVVA